MEKTETIIQYARRYSDPPEGVRDSSRAIIVKDGRILLTYEANTGVYMSPGGGIEPGETHEECCVRELREEAGYIVKPTEKFVTVNEYCYETMYISNYFICEITGECERTLTPIEIEHGVTPAWLDLDEAIEIFSHYPEKRTDRASLYLREYTVLTKYKAKRTAK